MTVRHMSAHWILFYLIWGLTQFVMGLHLKKADMSISDILAILLMLAISIRLTPVSQSSEDDLDLGAVYLVSNLPTILSIGAWVVIYGQRDVFGPLLAFCLSLNGALMVLTAAFQAWSNLND